jgi:hypothetical protein
LDPKQKRFILAEVQHINDEKYFEGERTKADPGNNFVLNWIKHYSQEYREAWEKSKCSKCENWDQCGKEVKLFCERFQAIQNINGEKEE